jgi:hypothetical protein
MTVEVHIVNNAVRHISRSGTAGMLLLSPSARQDMSCRTHQRMHMLQPAWILQVVQICKDMHSVTAWSSCCSVLDYTEVSRNCTLEPAHAYVAGCAAADLHCAGLTKVLNFAGELSAGSGNRTSAVLGEQMIQQGACNHYAFNVLNIAASSSAAASTHWTGALKRYAYQLMFAPLNCSSS